jgi:hypothetical protein
MLAEACHAARAEKCPYRTSQARTDGMNARGVCKRAACVTVPLLKRDVYEGGDGPPDLVLAIGAKLSCVCVCAPPVVAVRSVRRLLPPTDAAVWPPLIGATASRSRRATSRVAKPESPLCRGAFVGCPRNRPEAGSITCPGGDKPSRESPTQPIFNSVWTCSCPRGGRAR